MSGARQIACPTCKREFTWTEAALWRPFCSERCRLIDLGAWLGERHAIPGEPLARPAEAARGDDEHR